MAQPPGSPTPVRDIAAGARPPLALDPALPRGMFFLLAIAIDGYTGFNPLRNAVNGARSLAAVLQRKFGFAPERVRMLLETAATRDNILKVLREVILALGEHDSLVVYYAGHGHLDKELQIGYWIPVHAEPGNLGGWIAHKEIKEMLGAAKARHILLLVDSCFSGDLLRETGGPVVEISEPHVRYAFGRKSRHVLTSGANEPVADGGLPGHSVFTGILVLELEESRHPWVLIQDLHCRVRGAVAVNSGQKPQFGHLFGAGGESDGEFVLLNRAYQRETSVAEVTSTSPATVAQEAVYLKCPRCGARNLEKDTFECRVCHSDHLCAEERDPQERCCRDCAVRLGKAREEAELLARERAEADRLTFNGLGMKFVPVPGTEVWFSIWDTRVQDYEVFVKLAGREWLLAGFQQAPNHPAVNVSWEDAQVYCEWLTKRELGTGKLRPGEHYRLPTDEEWSVAVGLGSEEGKTPADKSGKAPEYPWGQQWPPPAAAGNYGSKKPKDSLFEFTSPVGSFAPNRFGLFDMGGNVWQWCEDEYGPGSGLRVLRGASWGVGAQGTLLSSYRGSRVSTVRRSNCGFRVVVAGASVPAMKWYRRAAEEGLVVAQSALAFMYANGQGVGLDYQEAGKWCRLAADQGFAVAQYNLGIMYSYGCGVEQDSKEAVKWYRFAAEQELAVARYALAFMYANGRGIGQDHKEALKWFWLAAEQGSARGQAWHGLTYEMGQQVGRDYKEVVKWHRIVAEQGWAQGQAWLGDMYLKGLGGLARDNNEAVKWYRLAAEQGGAYGQKRLGEMYLSGEGGLPQDAKEAFNWTRRAAEQGLSDAQRMLAIFYESGCGVVKDTSLAELWRSKSVASRHDS